MAIIPSARNMKISPIATVLPRLFSLLFHTLRPFGLARLRVYFGSNVLVSRVLYKLVSLIRPESGAKVMLKSRCPLRPWFSLAKTFHILISCIQFRGQVCLKL